MTTFKINEQVTKASEYASNFESKRQDYIDWCKIKGHYLQGVSDAMNEISPCLLKCKSALENGLEVLNECLTLEDVRNLQFAGKEKHPFIARLENSINKYESALSELSKYEQK